MLHDFWNELFGRGMLNMPINISSELTGIGTVVLAFGAIVTAILATSALRKQAREVRSIEKQVWDQEKLIKQQAELIQLQAEQSKLQQQQFKEQQQQFKEQREVNKRQAELVRLQTEELDASRKERASDRWLRYSAQASRVFMKTGKREDEGKSPGRLPIFTVYVHVRNTSEQPVYHVIVYVDARSDQEITESLDTIMPGDEASTQIHLPRGNLGIFSAHVRFRDAHYAEWEISEGLPMVEIRPEGRYTQRVLE